MVERLKQKFQFTTAGPHLSFVDTVNALTQILQALVLGEDALCPGTKRLHDFFRLGGIQENNALDPGPQRAHFSQQLRTAAWLTVQSVAENRDINGNPLRC